MKAYHVTRKLQITIPKVLARRLGIKPGDAVFFEQTGGTMVVKKAYRRVRDYDELVRTVQALAEDMPKVKEHVTAAERSIAASLSRHISTKR